MEKNYLSGKFLIKRILLISIIITFMVAGVQILSNKNMSPFIVSGQEDIWVLRIQITESSGKGATVILKGSSNASDGQDVLDIPIPPPPMPPYVRAWFTTPFSVPFNALLNESKHMPSERAVWNLSLIWVPESENDSLTTIEITWNPTQATQTTFTSLQLYQNNISLANMLTESTYSFPSNGTIHHFQIIGQTISNNTTSEQNNLPILPIALGIIVIVIVAIIALFWYKRKK